MSTASNIGQQARDKTKDAATSAANATKSAAESAKDTVHTAVDKAGDMASKAYNAAGDAASRAYNTASEYANRVGEKADDATASVGGGLKSAANTVRQNTPHEGMLGSASEQVASTLESAGSYLQDKGLSGIGDDLTGLIRRYPVPAVLIGVGLGFLIASAGSSRR